MHMQAWEAVTIPGTSVDDEDECNNVATLTKLTVYIYRAELYSWLDAQLIIILCY
jgi:hypothetical protein